ncbi:hypothetical protein AGMMS50230_11340 [Spirochaetia bacterium]|nr:hypothetical protein AGMMS50230_11340 [Spirochaetia bacterium]
MAKRNGDVAPEDNEFLKKFQGDIQDEDSFEEKTQYVADGLNGKNTGPIAKIWDKVQSLWAYVRSDKVPWTKKVLPLAGLVYLVSPIDLIPDFIPVAGLLDDMGVLGFIVYQMGSMLTAFAIASTVVYLAEITYDAIMSWVDSARNRHPDAKICQLIKEKLDSGNFRIVTGIFDSEGEELESNTWEGEELDPELKAEFGRKKKLVYNLTD